MVETGLGEFGSAFMRKRKRPRDANLLGKLKLWEIAML
jgi:hypothetical protein